MHPSNQAPIGNGFRTGQPIVSNLATAAPRELPEVEREFQALEEAISSAESAMCALVARLAPMQFSVEGCGIPSDASEVRPGSTIGARLRNSRDAINSIADRLRNETHLLAI